LNCHDNGNANNYDSRPSTRRRLSVKPSAPSHPCREARFRSIRDCFAKSSSAGRRHPTTSGRIGWLATTRSLKLRLRVSSRQVRKCAPQRSVRTRSQDNSAELDKTVDAAFYLRPHSARSTFGSTRSLIELPLTRPIIHNSGTTTRLASRNASGEPSPPERPGLDLASWWDHPQHLNPEGDLARHHRFVRGRRLRPIASIGLAQRRGRFPRDGGSLRIPRSSRERGCFVAQVNLQQTF